MPTPREIILFAASLAVAWVILGAVVIGLIEFLGG